MDGTLLYTLSTKLHFKTVKMSWHIQLKLLKRKSYSLQIQQAFTLLNLIYQILYSQLVAVAYFDPPVGL
jgi:hypothetical protein